MRHRISRWQPAVSITVSESKISRLVSATLLTRSAILLRRAMLLLNFAVSSFPHKISPPSSYPQSAARLFPGFLCPNAPLKSSRSPNVSVCAYSCKHTAEIPLFPLPLVLFPGAILPLQVFEFRYRIMMNTVLQTDRRFGIIYSDSSNGAADVGCVGEVIKYERLSDDRFFLICKGQERFRVINVLHSKPYLVAEVSWLEDKPLPHSDVSLELIATEVEKHMKNVIRLSKKLNGKPMKETTNLRKNLYPTPFSFFVGSTFEGAPQEQQALLELEDTAARLKREKEILRNTLNYLSAASAINDAFPSS